MKFQVPLPDAVSVTEAIKDSLGGRKLGDLLQVTCENPSTVLVEIRKMGTSTLEFSVSPKDNGVYCELVKEKIGFTHKMFESEVKEKIKKVIENLGGQILS